jgi:dTDP-4-dehydrorhamnose 3,5-epimerase
MIRFAPTALVGVTIVEPEVHRDARGFLVETYREDAFRHAGLVMPFVQENHSRSVRHTLRGLHFQAGPGQAKLVRVARGRVLDVAVDIRRVSATFGEYVAVELDDEAHRQLVIPEGFAHGFVVLSDVADVIYRLNRAYDPELERGLAWDDPDLDIRWPVAEPILSERDRANPQLRTLNVE